MATASTQTLAGKVAIVTGANTGIGQVTATQLALQGAHVFLACRSREKTQAVLDDIALRSGGRARAEFLALDLEDFASVRQCAAAFIARQLPLHILVNNAGLAGKKGFTTSGFELAFGVCHMGHFLLTRLLLDCLKASAPARVVVVASRAHRQVQGIDFESLRQPTASRSGIAEYGQAKLANILFSAELGRQLEGSGVTTYSLHPGVIASDVWREVPRPLAFLLKLFMKNTEEGARTSLYCATSAECAGQTGLYYDDCKVVRPSRAASDAQLARTLWQTSEDWLA
jgi:NAD(P)-dependent dehydrogenase (short-subunit alcohol dehydrogenase family)